MYRWYERDIRTITQLCISVNEQIRKKPWMTTKCWQGEELKQRHDYFIPYKKVKELTKTGKTKFPKQNSK